MTRVNKQLFNRTVHILGSILAVASIGFIVTILWSQREVVWAWRPNSTDILLLGFSILSYATAGMLLARGWCELLLWSGEFNVTTGDVIRIYGHSQIAKYIPGNFAQLLGRHVTGLRAGWSHTGLVLAGALEMVSLLFVASAIVIIGLSLNAISAELLSLPLITILAGGLILGTIGVLHVGPRIVEHRWPEVATRLRHCRLISLWRTGLMHLVFFGISGIIFLLLGFVIFNDPVVSDKWPGIFGLVALAWVAGIITPGAPSGIGVREGVLTLGLSGVAPIGEVVLLVTLFRFVTISGDIIFFLLSKRYGMRASSSPSVE